MLKYKTFVNFLNEAKKPSKTLVPEIMYEHAKFYKKEKEFESFINLLPTDAFKGIDLIFDKILSTESYIEEFFKNIYNYSSVEQIKKSDYERGLGLILFESEPKGLGRGELFIAWRVKDAEISGGGKSFDVQLGNKHYEVKDYSRNRDSIRVGVKGKVTNFEFWKEIVDTLRRIEKLSGGSNKSKFNFDKYFGEEFVTVVDYIKSNQAKWLSGEFNKEDLQNLQRFYQISNSLESNIDKDIITNVILRGPDVKPTELSIEPIHKKDIGDGQITLTKAPSDQSYTYILTELRRLKYVREPDSLLKDINQSIKDDIVGKIPFFIFRPDGPRIETEFQFERISQNGIKIIETRLAR